MTHWQAGQSAQTIIYRLQVSRKLFKCDITRFTRRRK